MYFILFVEGDTEDKVLPAFLKKWLNPKLSTPVDIRTVNFKGYANLCKDTGQRATMHLKGPRKKDIIAVISLLDLYGPHCYPESKITIAEKYEWGKKHLESQVKSPRFKQHFAVHELEAWLLSDPSIFPSELATEMEEVSEKPETVNFEQPPAKYLDDLYQQKLHKTYKKVTYGNRLFARLNPETVYSRCPYFKLLADDLLALARKHQGEKTL